MWKHVVNLPKKVCIKNFNSMLKKGGLLVLKLKAMRSRVWFRAFRRIDRVLVELALKVSDAVHSPILAKTLLVVVSAHSITYSPRLFQEV